MIAVCVPLSTTTSIWQAMAFLGLPAAVALVGVAIDRRWVVRAVALVLIPIGIVTLFSIGLAVLLAATLLLAASDRSRWETPLVAPRTA